MQIFIKHHASGKTLIFEVVQTDLIRHIKELVKDKTNDEIDSQILMIEDRQLENDRTIEYYDIVEEQTIELSILPTGAAADPELQFFVIIPANNSQRTCTIRGLNKDSTTLELKEKLSDMEGIPKDAMKLIFAGKPLTDDKTLEQFGLYEGCSVFLGFKVPGGFHYV